MQELNSRLGVGLNYDEYTDHVGDLRVAYDDVPFDELDANDLECVTGAGAPAENAFNEHVKAVNVWQKCFEDIDCDNDSIKPQVQQRWEKAGEQADQAEQALKDLRTAD